MAAIMAGTTNMTTKMAGRMTADGAGGGRTTGAGERQTIKGLRVKHHKLREAQRSARERGTETHAERERERHIYI